ncbi:MAG: RDD family protein [Leifsonia sp.]
MAKPAESAVHDQKVSDEHELITGEAVALDVRPAGVILRGAGTLIDWAAYVLLYLLMMLLSAWLFADILDDALMKAIGIAGLVFAILIVPMLVETVSGGRSLGKLAVGARIVRDDGGAIGLRHSFVRALLGVLEIYLTFGGIAATAGLLNSKSKRLGDLLAGTYSQHERVPRATAVARELPAELALWAQTTDVGRLPDPLARRVSQFLRQAPALTPFARAKMSASLAAEVAPYVSAVPPGAAETFLLGVQALRRDREYAALRREQAQQERLAPVLTGLPHDFPNR